MYSPYCGGEAAPDRKFCRSCGFSLTGISDVYPEERARGSEAAGGDRKAIGKARTRIGLTLMLGSFAAIFVAAYWVIISEIILAKGNVLGGVLFPFLVHRNCGWRAAIGLLIEHGPALI